MKRPAKPRRNAKDLMRFLLQGRDRKFPILDLLGLALLITIMATLMYQDPFRINYKILNFLRLKYAIFTREPKLLFYATAYIGSFIAKAIAILFIAALLIFRRISGESNLNLELPKSRAWIRFLPIFIILSVGIRVYYYSDPLIPNLPIRLVFPEAMIIGNAIIIFSVLFVAPITEELIFRGYMFDVVKRSFGSYPAVLFTSIIFALAHFPRRSLEVFDIAIFFILALIFGLARYKTNSTLVPMIFHAVYNIVYVSVGVISFFMLGY